MPLSRIGPGVGQPPLGRICAWSATQIRVFTKVTINSYLIDLLILALWWIVMLSVLMVFMY